MAFLTASLAVLALAQAPPPTLVSAHPCFSPEIGAQLTGAGWPRTATGSSSSRRACPPETRSARRSSWPPA